MSLISVLDFFELLPIYFSPSNPLPLSKLLELASEFLFFIKPSIPLKECYNSWFEENRTEDESEFEKQSLLVPKVLLNTCIFLVEIISFSTNQKKKGPFKENSIESIQILKKVFTDQRIFALLVLGCNHYPGFILFYFYFFFFFFIPFYFFFISF